jgi:hypothetical protein
MGLAATLPVATKCGRLQKLRDGSTAKGYSSKMSALVFDTLRLSRTLRDKGQFTSQQAEALAEALGEAAQGDLATKADLRIETEQLRTEIEHVRTELATTKGELKAEIEAVRTDIEHVRTEIATTKGDLLKWIVGAIGIQTIVILGALVSLIKAFTR